MPAFFIGETRVECQTDWLTVANLLKLAGRALGQEFTPGEWEISSGARKWRDRDWCLPVSDMRFTLRRIDGPTGTD